MRLHGDDPAFLRPDLLEEREQQLAPLGGLGLDLPELREVGEQILRPLDPWVDGRAESLHLLLDRLAAHDVLRFGEIPEHVQVLQALELAEQFAAPRARWVAPRTLCFDGLHHQVDQLLIGAEVVDPLDELSLQALG